jgi:hypothetical protein
MNKWPKQSQVKKFYGDPATKNFVHNNLIYIRCPWTLHMGKTSLNHILIHKKCADSLTRVLEHIWEDVDKSQKAIDHLHYDIFDGSYNFRKIRGGKGLSMHAYGVALDFDADNNEQHSKKHLFQHDDLITTRFREEGWTWGGDWKASSIDAMHFQAARI